MVDTTVRNINGSQLLVQIGDGNSPEGFAADCLINTQRGIKFNADTKDFVIPDCLNPNDPAWKEVVKDGLSATIDGAGMLHTPSVKTWFNWFKSKDPKNCRVKINGVTGADGGGYWQGEFHLTNFDASGDRTDKATVTATLVSNGVISWVDNA